MKLEHVELILGIEWFKTLDAKIHWQNHVVSFNFKGTPISIQGDFVNPNVGPIVYF